MNSLDLRPLIVRDRVEASRLFPPPPPHDLQSRTASRPDRYRRPGAEDGLGELVIRLGIVPLVRDDDPDLLPRNRSFLQHRDEVRRVGGRPQPELDRRDHLLPRFDRDRLLNIVFDHPSGGRAARPALPPPDRRRVVLRGGGGGEPGRVDRKVEAPKPRLPEAGEEEAFQPPRLGPRGELLKRREVRDPSQLQLLVQKRTNAHHLAEVPIRRREMLAEHQHHDVLVIAVQIVRILRPPTRIPGPPQYPHHPPNDANEFMLLRHSPIRRHEAIPFPEPGVLSEAVT